MKLKTIWLWLAVLGSACGGPDDRSLPGTPRDGSSSGSGGAGGSGGGMMSSGGTGGGGSGGSGQGGASGSGGVGGTGGVSGAGGGPGGGGGGGIRDGGAPGPDGAVSFEVGSMTCGEMTTAIPFSPKTPDVVIAFDVSGSMSNSFGTGTRYTTERDIMVPLVNTYQDRIRWGYEEFPRKNCFGSGGACPDKLCATIGCAGAVVVQPAFMNAAMVNAHVENKVNPSCGGGAGTPTPGALRLIREFYAGFVDGIKERYVLLSTDGEPNQCNGDECNKSVAEITAMLNQGVKTIVLGVSQDVGASSCLNRMAMAGGVPRPGGPPHYYAGSDPASLKKYLEEIVTGIAKPSCKIDLTSPPPDATKVGVFFDKKQIPWDPARKNGWDYAPGSTTQIIIYGSYCTSLETFAVKDLGVLYGCPPCGGTVGCGP